MKDANPLVFWLGHGIRRENRGYILVIVKESLIIIIKPWLISIFIITQLFSPFTGT